MGKESDTPRTVPGGTAVPDGQTVNIYRQTDLVNPVASLTLSGGKYTHRYDGSYGPIRTSISYSGQTRIRDSWAVGQAGAVPVGELPILWQGNPGVVPTRGHELQVVQGTGKTVNVRDGALVSGSGITYVQYTDNKQSPTFADNSSGNPRIDTLCVRTWSPEDAQEGRSELAIVQGTPAASPIAPTLTQVIENGQYYEPLADVLLANGYSSITTGNITDRRRFQIGSAGNDESLFDKMAAILTAGAGISLTPNDTTNRIAIAGLLALGGLPITITRYTGTDEVNLGSGGQSIAEHAANLTGLVAGRTYTIIGIAWACGRTDQVGGTGTSGGQIALGLNTTSQPAGSRYQGVSVKDGHNWWVTNMDFVAGVTGITAAPLRLWAREINNESTVIIQSVMMVLALPTG